MILGAEYIFRVVPKGTHLWSKFITPYELTKICESNNLKIINKRGHFYNILNDSMFKLPIMPVNYILAF